ncbi:rRNA-processing protein UTP23 homolog [Zeugodacus cucurbitae]|uniref:rRNA-processing protein UTP23 homolog n=1 Tax=Zeugodacus cucurbitae TaxID=28588 RepID=A0A0A1WF16_ZEUCU|nr:rRNA-processing protein UTP23 homolog [Zeugodacus cucurbitae]
MKISRFKKAHKTLSFFATNFEYREPYQILIDATFCQLALQNKVIIEEQIKKYFQSTIKLITTQCVILEAESLGSPLAGATMIVKQFHVHKCGHEGAPVPASQCIKSMTKGGRYIVASQDRSLQTSLRKVPGRILLYLHKATPVLEEPSEASKKYVSKKYQKSLTSGLENHVENLKQIQILQNEKMDNRIKQRRGPKNPNPLSCKKSTKQKGKTQNKIISKENKLRGSSKVQMKKKRKRIKTTNRINST